jgi:hypothetical protein
LFAAAKSPSGERCASQPPPCFFTSEKVSKTPRRNVSALTAARQRQKSKICMSFPKFVIGNLQPNRLPF